jgi:threonine synthase
MIDPHTADGVKVAREHRHPGLRTIVLETALPLKFEDIIREATGHAPRRPAAVADLEQRPRRFEVVAPSVDAVMTYIAQHCAL